MMNKINEEQLKEVNGGYLFDTTEIYDIPYESSRWEIIDSKGDVVDKAPNLITALKRADALGESLDVLNWEQLQRLRETGSPD